MEIFAVVLAVVVVAGLYLRSKRNAAIESTVVESVAPYKVEEPVVATVAPAPEQPVAAVVEPTVKAAPKATKPKAAPKAKAEAKPPVAKKAKAAPKAKPAVKTGAKIRVAK